MTDEQLTKIYVNLPGHWYTSAESLWAKWLGGDLYELRSVPFAAYGLNFGDIVEAATTTNALPCIQRVVTPSGRRTLRLFFNGASVPDQSPHLDRLAKLGAEFERATDSLVAIDVPAEADYDAICEALWSLEQQGVLDYETCEQRRPGTFTDLPSTPDHT